MVDDKQRRQNILQTQYISTPFLSRRSFSFLIFSTSSALPQSFIHSLTNLYTRVRCLISLCQVLINTHFLTDITPSSVIASLSITFHFSLPYTFVASNSHHIQMSSPYAVFSYLTQNLYQYIPPSPTHTHTHVHTKQQHSSQDFLSLCSLPHPIPSKSIFYLSFSFSLLSLSLSLSLSLAHTNLHLIWEKPSAPACLTFPHWDFVT